MRSHYIWKATDFQLVRDRRGRHRIKPGRSIHITDHNRINPSLASDRQRGTFSFLVLYLLRVGHIFEPWCLALATECHLLDLSY